MINVVYDMDGVLNNLNELVFNALGIYNKFLKLKYYNIYKNNNLSDIEKKAIVDCYNSSDIFRRLSAVSGADRIADIEELAGVKVFIHSLCFNDEIADIKKQFIKDNIPNFKIENAILEVSDIKECLNDIDIIVEDSLENLLKYNNCYKILIDKPYNQYKNYGIHSTDIIRVSDLEEAIKTVESIVLKKGRF